MPAEPAPGVPPSLITPGPPSGAHSTPHSPVSCTPRPHPHAAPLPASPPRHVRMSLGECTRAAGLRACPRYRMPLTPLGSLCRAPQPPPDETWLQPIAAGQMQWADAVWRGLLPHHHYSGGTSGPAGDAGPPAWQCVPAGQPGSHWVHSEAERTVEAEVHCFHCSHYLSVNSRTDWYRPMSTQLRTTDFLCCYPPSPMSMQPHTRQTFSDAIPFAEPGFLPAAHGLWKLFPQACTLPCHHHSSRILKTLLEQSGISGHAVVYRTHCRQATLTCSFASAARGWARQTPHKSCCRPFSPAALRTWPVARRGRHHTGAGAAG